MKKALILTALTAVICIWIPWLAVGRPGGATGDSQPTAPKEEITPMDTETNRDEKISLTVLMKDGSTRTMTLGEYLLGAVMGEMPKDFPQEAQKAQAVVCRTYTLRQSQGEKHDGADICTDSTCCQAWQDPAAFSQETSLPAKTAILATDGEVLSYEGKLIDATFFSSSGGRTEAAVAVWGTDIPYLQAVDSPGENAPYDGDYAEFTPQELRLLLLTADPTANLSGSPEGWIEETVLTPGEGVATMTIGGVSFTGKELRSLLGLRSTVFTPAVEDGVIRFYTQGYGHRVGMSQYGAKAMALEGSTYEEILMHYYTRVELGWYEG